MLLRNSDGGDGGGYYPDDGGDESAPAETETRGGEESMEGETALLPTSILGGKEFKPGDEVVLRIVHMGDGEVEVAYAKDDKKGDDNMNSGEPKPEMDGAMGKLNSMAG